MPRLPPAVASVTTDLRGEGMSYQAIAETLNDRAVPTAQGGKAFGIQTVANVVRRSANE